MGRFKFWRNFWSVVVGHEQRWNAKEVGKICWMLFSIVDISIFWAIFVVDKRWKRLRGYGCKTELSVEHLFSSVGLTFMKDFNFLFSFLILSLPFIPLSFFFSFFYYFFFSSLFFFYLFFYFFFPSPVSKERKKAISLSKKELIKQINQFVLLRNYKVHVQH